FGWLATRPPDPMSVVDVVIDRQDEVPKQYLPAVEKGLDYLAKNQCEDGHWEGNEGKHPTAMTGLAGTAMLIEGSRGRDYRHQVDSRRRAKKAADWLMDQNKGGGGLIFSGHPSETSRYMEGHGLATIFLAGALRAEIGRAQKERLTSALNDAVKYIARSQS